MKKPNILFILSDDQGAWAMNCAGTPELETPNLNRIANSGMRFEDFFCVSPVCSPARASILTGTIPSAHGVHDWLRSGNMDKEKFLEASKEIPYGGYADEKTPIQYLSNITTYTDVLTQNGYTCALSGKWHLGDSINPQHGFKYWYTIGKGGCFYYHPDMVSDGVMTVEHDKYVTDLITDKGLEFIDTLSKKDEPFYLSVHYTAPHAPWGAEHHKKEWIEHYDGCEFESVPNVLDHSNLKTGPVYGTEKRHENLRGYFSAISAMDEGIGRLLDSLEEHNILDDTIVIFTADNGMSMGHHGIWGKGNGTFPLNMYDTAVKVPFLISYPRLIKKGQLCKEMVSAYDIFPTLLDLVNVNNSATAHLPGKTFFPFLSGEDKENSRNNVVVFDEYGPVRMIRTKEYKLIMHYPFGENEFYDLTKDEEENVNEIANPIYQDRICELRCQLEKWFIQYVNPNLDGLREEVTGGGQLCSAGIHAQYAKKYSRYDE